VPFGHHLPVAPAAPGDTWLNVVLGIAALAGILTFVVALPAAILYSRKATIKITAKGHRTAEDRAVLAVRPSVTAIGPFALRFSRLQDEGAWIHVFNMVASATGVDYGDLALPAQKAFDVDEKGLDQFVHPGETLTNTVPVQVATDIPGLVGWTVTLNVDSAGWRRGMHWLDRAFVPLPQ